MLNERFQERRFTVRDVIEERRSTVENSKRSPLAKQIRHESLDLVEEIFAQPARHEVFKA